MVATSVFSAKVLSKACEVKTIFDPLDKLYAEHVIFKTKEGIGSNLVDYEAISQPDAFDDIYAHLNGCDIHLKSRDEKLVFYINLYNYLTLKLVADEEPEKTINELGWPGRPVWKRHLIKLNGKQLSLDAIEHEIIRPLGEPRIHFALVCASLSCPDLRQEIFKIESLDTQLDEQTARFLSNPTKGISNVYEGESKNITSVNISTLFKWFERDFEEGGGVIEFIRTYQKEIPKDVNVKHIHYSWTLNRQ